MKNTITKIIVLAAMYLICAFLNYNELNPLEWMMGIKITAVVLFALWLGSIILLDDGKVRKFKRK